MLTLKNTSKGPRLVLMEHSQYERIMPGETRTIDGSKVVGIPDGLEEISTKAAEDRGGVPEQPQGLEQQVSKAAKGEDLSKLKVAELEDRLKAAGVDLEQISGTGAEGKVIKADLIRALEDVRAAQ